MNRVIVTGADGFVGSRVVEQLVESGKDVLAIDLAAEPMRLGLGGGFSYLAADVFELDSWTDKVGTGWDSWIHLAWAGSAGDARSDYQLQMKNALATVSCMKAAKGIGCSRFICAGSIMEKEAAAAVESQGSRPGMAYLYGIGKFIAHCLCKPIASAIGIDLVWPLITNAYGEGERSPRFINTTIRKMINGESLQFTSATQNYDFIHIDDVARAFLLISENGKPFHEYVIGSGQARPLKDFILEMRDALAPGSVPMFGDVPFTGTNLDLSVFDTTVTERDTGFKARVSFAEGTRRTMNWLIEIDGGRR